MKRQSSDNLRTTAWEYKFQNHSSAPGSKGAGPFPCSFFLLQKRGDLFLKKLLQKKRKKEQGKRASPRELRRRSAVQLPKAVGTWRGGLGGWGLAPSNASWQGRGLTPTKQSLQETPRGEAERGSFFSHRQCLSFFRQGGAFPPCLMPLGPGPSRGESGTCLSATAKPIGGSLSPRRGEQQTHAEGLFSECRQTLFVPSTKRKIKVNRTVA